MDFRNILGKLTLLEGSMDKAKKNPTGPKFTGQWSGSDAGTPGKKLVGDSVEPEENILKDLGKGPTAKTKEQELAEAYRDFLSDEEEDPMAHAHKLASMFLKSKRNWENLELGSLGYTKNGDINVELITPGGAGSHHTIDGQTGKELTNVAESSEQTINPDTMLTFLRDAFKAINDRRDSYFTGGFDTMRKIYENLRRHLMKDDIAGFESEWDYWSGETPDAFDELIGEAFDIIGVNTYEEFMKAATDVELSEDDLGVNPKRPGREGGRHARGHEPIPGYKTVKQETEESRGHTVIASKLKDIEARKTPADDEAYQAHIDRMKAKMKEYQAANPNSIYKKVDEYGANQPAGTAGQKMVQTAMPTTQDVAAQAGNNPQQVAAVAQATQTIKSASGATAPNDVISKALDAVSKGQQVSPQDMKTLEPVLKNVAAAGQDPGLANDYKTLAQKAKIFQQTNK